MLLPITIFWQGSEKYLTQSRCYHWMKMAVRFRGPRCIILQLLVRV